LLFTDAWAIQFCCNADERTSGALSDGVLSEYDSFGCDAALMDAAASSSSSRGSHRASEFINGKCPPHMVAGQNTSTISLQVIESNEKGARCLGVSLRNINTGTWSSRLGIGCEADDLAL
jgi:hypothetical protein